jgi:hypothetical protein
MELIYVTVTVMLSRSPVHFLGPTENSALQSLMAYHVCYAAFYHLESVSEGVSQLMSSVMWCILLEVCIL